MNSDDGEVWKDVDVENWPFHQISNRGRVRALPGAKRKGRRIALQIELLKQTTDRKGYMTVRKRETVVKVHRLVLNAFVGPRPSGQECRHLNGNRSDNRWPENIKWGTPKENYEDKTRHRTDGRGERHSQAILTQSQVDDIRSRKWYHGFDTRLGEEFGVSSHTIRSIRIGKNWKDKKTEA
jgi:hypothetical protein